MSSNLKQRDTSTTEALTEHLAGLPEGVSTQMAQAMNSLSDPSLSATSVHLLYAEDSAAFNLGVHHPVTRSLRQFRSVVMNARFDRTPRTEVTRAAERCLSVLLMVAIGPVSA